MTDAFPTEPLTPQLGAMDLQDVDVVEYRRLKVDAVDGVAALERFAADIDRLNAASRRPNPFLSSAFLRCYALRAEYHTPGQEERLFVIRDGTQVIGCAPMRRTIDRFGIDLPLLRFPRARLRLLAPLDTEQPGVLAAAGDEDRVAAALIRHITLHERDCGMVDLVGQRPGDSLHRALHAAADRRFRARDIAVEPFNEIPMSWPSLPAYFQSLAKKMRSNVSRQARRLYAHGEPEIILAEGREAVTAWFDAYVDLDGRSWKSGTQGSIARHPRRLRFYHDIVCGRGGLDPAFIGIVLDGVLIAGLIMGSNESAAPEAHGAWCLEMAYDQSRAALGPGQLLLLLAVGLAIERKHRFLNFMQNFSYYKHRWAAEPIDVVSAQLIRRASLHNVRATLGELRKKLRGPGSPSAPAAEPQPEDIAETGSTDLQKDERARSLTAAALACAGSGMRRLDRALARSHLPFGIE